jgi:RHS repeat-associated protein
MSNIPVDYTNQNVCMAYDNFGNRTASSPQSAACPANESTVTATVSYGTNNQITGGQYGYDASGDVTTQPGYSFLYDAEGRICAVNNGYGYTGYLYDAEGQRVAKGAISSWSCNPGTNGFTLTESYVLGPGGEELTMADGNGNWQRTNVYGQGKLLATYDTEGLHFHLTDPLGTRRMQTNDQGVAELDCESMPFGDQAPPCHRDANAIETVADASPLHFTGKERDSESGNDYFSARYLGSSMGRFLTPDPLPWIHWQHGNDDDRDKFEAYIANPQNFNMYAYVNNNPLNHTDPTGMNACGTKNDSTCNVTVTISDRSKDANGHYNDQFTGVARQGDYNATAVVSVNGKEVGTFLVKTTPDNSSKSATLATGTYSGTLTTHDGHSAIRLQPTLAVPTEQANPSRKDGAWLAQGILVHIAGGGNSGWARHGRPISEGCQVVCTSQYADFERATGMSATPPQQHFTVNVWSSANYTPSEAGVPIY